MCFLLASKNEYQCLYVVFLVPPKADNPPDFIRGDLRKNPQRDLSGPYLQHVNEDFTCHIRGVLPGKDNTLFALYYDGKTRTGSDRVGEVVETDEFEHTKHVVWTFSTSFNRSDNGGNMRCIVSWEVGQYSRRGLKSELTENVQVICKYPMIHSSSCAIKTCEETDILGGNTCKHRISNVVFTKRKVYCWEK